MAKFCSLFSGSSGNCIYIESGGTAILIDAGVSCRAIVNALKGIGSDISKVGAVLVTHEHSDHISGLSMLAVKQNIPVYANAGTINGILADRKKIDSEHLHEIKTGSTTEICGMYVTSFGTSHDSRESVGYRIHTSDGRRIAVATDLGFVSEMVMTGLRECELVMIESNHDVGMLKNGRYPYFLKRRILSERGHLSNDDCAAVLPELIRGGTNHFILAHLSKDNNLPELALQTAVCSLQICGASQGNDYEIEAAPAAGPGRLYQI